MNIIITGGSEGIGKELVLNMSNDKNNQILITGRNVNTLKKITETCKNRNVSFARLDLSVIETNSDSIRDQIFNRFSKLDILINCAGSLIVSDFLKISDQDARKMMDINFFGTAAFIKLLVPLMSAGSHIVNISSMGGFQGSAKYKGLAYYSASKAAIGSLTECLAVEFRELGISVNCLAPGSVQTEMFVNAFPGLKAPVRPEEIAGFIGYFAINGNKFFNGKILPMAIIDPS